MRHWAFSRPRSSQYRQLSLVLSLLRPVLWHSRSCPRNNPPLFFQEKRNIYLTVRSDQRLWKISGSQISVSNNQWTKSGPCASLEGTLSGWVHTTGHSEGSCIRLSKRGCSQLWKFTGWQGESKNNRTIKWPNTSQGLLSGKVSERENEVLLGFWVSWFSGHMWSEENGAVGGRSGGRPGERGYLFHRQSHSWPAWPVWLHTRQKVCNAFWQRGRKTQRQAHLITELLLKADSRLCLLL